MYTSDILWIASLRVKYRTSVTVSSCIYHKYISISPMILVLILNCTWNQAGILHGTESSNERNRLREIKKDPTVRVLAKEKNLGPAPISTEWIEQETLKHLLMTLNLMLKPPTKDDWKFIRQRCLRQEKNLLKVTLAFYLQILTNFFVVLMIILRAFI